MSDLIDETEAGADPSDCEQQVVRKLCFRPWEDRCLRWSHQKPEGRWMAYYNGAEVAGIADKRKKHFGGKHYAWMFQSRLNHFPESVEQGKEWIETLFAEWVKRAASDFLS